MNRIITVVLAGICGAVSTKAQTTFSKLYGGISGDEGRYVVQTTDGGYAVLGSTQSYGAGNWDLMLLKLDANGDLQWSKTYGNTGEDLGNFVRVLSDGGFLLVGSTEDAGASTRDVYVLRTTPSGDVAWSQRVGDSAILITTGARIPTNEVGFYADVVANGFTVFADGGSGTMVINLDPQGNFVSSKYVTDYHAESSAPATDGGYVFGGWKSGYLKLVKTDADCNPQWAKQFTSDDDKYGGFVCVTSDGGYAILGTSDPSGLNNDDLYLVKTDASGTVQWSRIFGGAAKEEVDGVQSITPTTDGLLIATMTLSVGHGSRDGYLLKFDNAGNLLWSRAVGGNNDDRCYSVIQASDGGILTSGFLAGSQHRHAFLFKTDASGNGSCASMEVPTIIYPDTTITSTFTATVETSTADTITHLTLVNNGITDSTACNGVGISEKDISNALVVYPNPATDKIVIDASAALRLVTVYDVLGTQHIRVIMNSSENVLSVNDLANGLYVIQTVEGKTIHTTTFTKH